MYKKLLVYGVVFFCAIVLLATPVKADLIASDLTGLNMSWQYYAYGGAYTHSGYRTAGTFVVPSGGGIVGTFDPYFNIIANSTSITFAYMASDTWANSTLSLGPTIYNGIAIDMLTVGGIFSSVTIDPSTNMAGFDASRLSFTNGEIQVDWAGLSFNSGTILKLDIVDDRPGEGGGNTIVPEPTTMLLLGLGLIGVAVVRRRMS
jgi:hypothetical protein